MPDFEINTGDREAAIAALRELADFLTGNPEVLVPPYLHVGVIVRAADDDARRRGTEFAAARAGVPVQDLGFGYYSAFRKFGPLTYFVSAVPPKDQP